MIGKIFCIMASISFVFASVTDRMNELSSAVVEGAQGAVELTISLVGVMCLWSGCVAVLEKLGVVEVISRVIRPVIYLVYPSVRTNSAACDSICTNFAANFLGLGNAALPTGIRAMQALAEKNGNSTRACGDMMNFAVMNTVPFQLLPTTLAALRASSGSKDPFSILVPMWITSVGTIIFAAVLCRILGYFAERRKNE